MNASIADQLLLKVLKDYPLNLHGIHGIGHWCRVMDYGLLLSEKTGADREVVVLFGLLHDSVRCNDGKDNGHGERAGEYARHLADIGLLDLSDDKLKVLVEACASHTTGWNFDHEPCITVKTCLDSDKLDLHRFGWGIDPARLETQAAVEVAAKGKFINPKRFLRSEDLLNRLLAVEAKRSWWKVF